MPIRRKTIMMMISAIRSFPSCRPVLQRVRCGVPALSTVRIGSIIPIMESGDRRFNSTSTTTPLKGQFHTTPANDSDFSTDPGLDTKPTSVNLPKRLRHKVLSAEDAVSLVRDGDTVCATGFVCQGTLSIVHGSCRLAIVPLLHAMFMTMGNFHNSEHAETALVKVQRRVS